MIFGPLPPGTNFYIVNALLIALYMISGIIGLKAKQNYFIGIRTYETLGNPEIWKKANIRICSLVIAFTIPLLIINIVFAVLKLQTTFAYAILGIFFVGILALNFYGSIYAQNLAKEQGIEVKKVHIPPYVYIILILSVIILAVVWHLIFK